MAQQQPSTKAVLASVLRSLGREPKNRRLIALVLLGAGGVTAVAASQLAALRAQSQLDKASALVVLAGQPKAAEKPRGPKPPGVDRKFAERMLFILRIVVPSWRSQEAFMLATQTVVLVARSLLSLRIARLSGDGLKARAQPRAQAWPSIPAVRQ